MGDWGMGDWGMGDWGIGKRTDDFTRLVRGDAVTVEGSSVSMQGTVEEVAPDRSVLWVLEHGGHSRYMVHRTDTVVVTRVEAGWTPAAGAEAEL
ncbi:hypothetical protein [Sinomonas humi]|uniref:DUF5666 domain-containing protein n=1 Tax=Sinomonas humi TaxID=1338436 RepID=A0A0B2AK97_9MICC|nr:hypothetical protein [Sinomonas humi]KHL02265.1 hypothetical protein LK10_13465 [Sinomonas humi]